MIAEVRMWGRRIGAVSMHTTEPVARFEYDAAFRESSIEVSPIRMPLSDQVYAFPALERTSFHGLPGLVADSLPDRFGNALIDAWLAAQGRTPESFSPVERLCYTGSRGMGALEYRPVTGPHPGTSEPLEVSELVELASAVLSDRGALHHTLGQGQDGSVLQDILLVGTSAGGARAKAVIAWNPQTNEVRSGQVNAPDGFEHWLLKFDGVRGNKDKELEDPAGYGAIEYAYALMAQAAGISMMPCRLLEEGGRRHFMTKRFDRTDDGHKLHMHSLGALVHVDYNVAGAYSYEQALLVCRQLRLPMADIEELYRRIVFNIVARNQDDHVKNIAFLMDKAGGWSLAPGFDLTYSYNPSGRWTAVHQMSMNGKRTNFTADDFAVCAKAAMLKRGRHTTILNEVRTAVHRWPEFASAAGVDEATMERIGKAHEDMH